ncbi:MAG: carbohydrate-binding domain-containing protein [Clostridia bacterium]|nr:carbohydrate-binding domain-containing protein [Clostridia bacterium]
MRHMKYNGRRWILPFLLLLSLLISSCETAVVPAETGEVPSPQSISVDTEDLTSVFTEDPVYEGDLKVETETSDGYTLTGSTLKITAAGDYTLSGSLSGKVVVEAGDEDKVKIILSQCSISSSADTPVEIVSCGSCVIQAAEGTVNTIEDSRAQASSSEDPEGGAVYAASDLTLSGKGALKIVSSYNNGVHTKDDLKIKDLTLYVEAVNHALRGNDSVTVESGSVTLVSTGGDGIKTSSSDVSEKGNQRGNVEILGGSVLIQSARDGIDCAYNAVISGDASLRIYTEKYVSDVSTEETLELYLVVSKNSCRYAVLWTDGSENEGWAEASYATSIRSGRTQYGGWLVKIPSSAVKLQIFRYSSSSTGYSKTDYDAVSDEIALNREMNAIFVSDYAPELKTEWVTVRTSSGIGGSSKSLESAKGIKAANEIQISGGTTVIESGDDGLHANSGNALENGSKPTGNIEISGGYLSIAASDDGIRADGTLSISGGNTVVSKAHEGLEGNVIKISGGATTVVGDDDGMNACKGTSTPQIIVSGGWLDVTVSPSGDTDGIDSNGSYTQTGGIVITRGPNMWMAAALDTESGAKITGGTLIVLGYGQVTSGSSVKTYSLSLHASGSHTITVNGTEYSFTNAYSYGKTTVYSSVTVSGS